MCPSGKRYKFSTKALAKQWCKTSARRLGLNLTVYQCPLCGAWHTTSKRKKARVVRA